MSRSGTRDVTQKGKGIFLGKPVATPTGLMIGKPGLWIFAKGGQSSFTSLVIDFTGGLTLDLTSMSIVFESP